MLIIDVILLAICVAVMAYITYTAIHPSELKLWRQYLMEQYAAGQPVQMIYDQENGTVTFPEEEVKPEYSSSDIITEELPDDCSMDSIIKDIISQKEFVDNVLLTIKNYDEYVVDAKVYIIDTIKGVLTDEDEAKIQDYINNHVLKSNISEFIKERYNTFVDERLKGAEQAEKEAEVYNNSFGPDDPSDGLHPVEPKIEESTDDEKDIKSIEDLVSTGTVEDIEK